MSRRHKRWITHTHSFCDGTWGAEIRCRITGRGDGWPGTSETRTLMDDSGKPAVFPSNEAARAAVDAAEKAGGPWGPIQQWRTI